MAEQGYDLMHKDDVVASLQLDDLSGAILKVTPGANPELLPPAADIHCRLLPSFIDCAILNVLNNSETVRYEQNKNLQKIGSYAFYNCGIENRLELPYGIKYVQTSSFVGNKIPAIKIPSSVTNLGYDALKGNKQLTEIVLNNAQSAASESWVLTGIPISCTLYVPTGTVQQYKNNSKWGTLNVKAGAFAARLR